MHNVSSRRDWEIRSLVALYAGASLAFIWASEQVLSQWLTSAPALIQAHQWQGLALVVATSAFFYGLLVWRERRFAKRQAAIAETEQYCQQLLTGCPQACWIHDSDTLEILTANKAASQLCGYSTSELAHLNVRDLAAPENIAALAIAVEGTSKGQPATQPCQIRDRQGELHEVEMAIAPIAYAGRPAHLALLRDATANRQLEAKLHRYAFYDLLTQLPNKTWFLARLGEQLQATRSGKASFFTVIFLELDRFHSIKYSLGHSFAEAVLVATAERLQSCLNLAEPAARVGDCSLAVVLDNIYTPLDADAIADYIHQQLSQPLEVNQRELFSTACIGIAIVDSPELAEQPPEAILQAADTAMNHARQKLKTTHAIFEPAMFELAVGRFHLETDLRRAIARQELCVFYQPIIALHSGELAGFEALVRWQHPDGHWIDPDRFIPVAEETGLIGLIDWWVLGEACKQLGAWQRALPKGQSLTLSINASLALLEQLGFLDRLRQTTAANHLQRGSLKLEVTERAIVEHSTTATGILEAIKSLGIQLAIDDFGTGYSCLERLYRLPVDTLKIDRSFVQLMLADPDSLEIIRSILLLARGLGMNVVAEGPETAAQVQQLQALGCEYSQGYFFAEPMPAEDAGQLLARRWQW